MGTRRFTASYRKVQLTVLPDYDLSHESAFFFYGFDWSQGVYEFIHVIDCVIKSINKASVS